MKRVFAVLGQVVAAFFGVSGFRVCQDHKRGCPPGAHGVTSAPFGKVIS